MKRIALVFLAVLCASLCASTPSPGGPNAGGTLILHWNSAPIDYTGDPAFIDGGLISCQDAVTQAPPATQFPSPPWSQRRIWFAYAAFPQGSSPRLKAVALGVTYNLFVNPAGVRVDFVVTPPGTTEAQTSSPAWPAPNSGNALVFATTMTSLVDEILVFAGYGSQGQIFALRTHPTTASNFADDAVPANQDPILDFGSLGFGVPGRNPCHGGSACCFPGGSCQIFHDEMACAAAGGIWQGESTDCDPNPCSPPLGACCFVNCTCQVLTAEDCQNSGGLWSGPGTTCSPSPCSCPPGACCFSNGSCQLLNVLTCAPAGGIYQGPGTTCTPNPCPLPVAACCFQDCSCEVLTASACSDSLGTWQGPGTTCSPSPCDCPTGACCFFDCHCEIVTQAECSGEHWYMETPCDPNPCPCPLGACCFPNGICQFVSQAQCPTGEWIEGMPCVPNPCGPETGACCFRDHSCLVRTEFVCADSVGVWQGPGTTCDPNPCPYFPGRCCHPDGSCEFVIEPECSNGNWQLGIDCEPNTCSQPQGACCLQDCSCLVLYQPACEDSLGGIWMGPNTPCQPNPCSCPPGACCHADGTCSFVQESQCSTGDWRPGVPCEPNPCLPPTGACCFESGECRVLNQIECEAQGGAYVGDDVACTPQLCAPVPVERYSWGKIKSHYR